MAEEPECQLRRRRSSGNPNLPLNLEVGYQVNEGGPSQGTPSPGCFRRASNSTDSPATSTLLEFRKKQQSFDIQVVQIEECEEEEIMVDSDDEGGEENGAAGADRPITPTPIQDFGANVVYTEGPQTTDFLKVKTIEHDCVTDVSDADSDAEDE
ncbi:uncharacterized protein LOC126377409 [Pectinophora gossypiella]|uniref:uncharacterized protein LOC126377409 n=1 Tax=Pectinophora gossypiella TaxID=13191 RepID=UPI00214E9798|nr:uncharacterized protein LOC126377409 [Pectinophora gossypiella]XP_049881112.1 uncharacterized protein LOC126377409 [Pectinophora gossypiella]XP_049881121.1 uncharacterized protein LOC126377409 [Pectinophora gossypiella]